MFYVYSVFCAGFFFSINAVVDYGKLTENINRVYYYNYIIIYEQVKKCECVISLILYIVDIIVE